MKQNTTPVVKVINGVHTFTNLNPDAKYFGLSEDDFFRMDVEDERYTGNYFDYDVDHRFSWSLNGMFFFEYAYDFEVANGI